jgi:xylitol oxidase
MIDRRNWADNHSFIAARMHRPQTVDDVRRIVAGAAKVHAIGVGHSFNGVADTPGDLIDLSAMEPGFQVDPAAMTVTVSAGTAYGELAAYLQARGYALHNMASLPHVTVAGATATGTHGSGDRNGVLSTAVAGLELVLADGDVLRIGRGHDGFDGMVVGLGAFGVVTKVTLDILPSYTVRQDAFVGLPWQCATQDFDAVSSLAHSFSLLTKWSGEAVDRVWLKVRIGDPEPGARMADLGARVAPVPATGADDPSARLNPFGVPGPWSQRMAHFRPDVEPGVLDQIQSEYMVPRDRLAQAVTILRAMGSRIDPLLYATEIRTMAADDLWLSPAQGRDSVGIHFTWKREPDAVSAITQQIEDLLLPLGARPHWGKLIHADAARLAPLYPRMAAFQELVRRFDPAGKFRNAYLDRHVLG